MKTTSLILLIISLLRGVRKDDLKKKKEEIRTNPHYIPTSTYNGLTQRLEIGSFFQHPSGDEIATDSHPENDPAATLADTPASDLPKEAIKGLFDLLKTSRYKKGKRKLIRPNNSSVFQPSSQHNQIDDSVKESMLKNGVNPAHYKKYKDKLPELPSLSTNNQNPPDNHLLMNAYNMSTWLWMMKYQALANDKKMTPNSIPQQQHQIFQEKDKKKPVYQTPKNTPETSPNKQSFKVPIWGTWNSVLNFNPLNFMPKPNATEPVNDSHQGGSDLEAIPTKPQMLRKRILVLIETVDCQMCRQYIFFNENGMPGLNSFEQKLQPRIFIDNLHL